MVELAASAARVEIAASAAVSALTVASAGVAASVMLDLAAVATCTAPRGPVLLRSSTLSVAWAGLHGLGPLPTAAVLFPRASLPFPPESAYSSAVAYSDLPRYLAGTVGRFLRNPSGSSII